MFTVNCKDCLSAELVGHTSIPCIRTGNIAYRIGLAPQSCAAAVHSVQTALRRCPSSGQVVKWSADGHSTRRSKTHRSCLTSAATFNAAYYRTASYFGFSIISYDTCLTQVNDSLIDFRRQSPTFCAEAVGIRDRIMYALSTSAAVSQFYPPNFLWPPYLIGGHYILPCNFFLSIYLSSFFRRLTSAAAGWMSTIL